MSFNVFGHNTDTIEKSAHAKQNDKDGKKLDYIRFSSRWHIRVGKRQSK